MVTSVPSESHPPPGRLRGLPGTQLGGLFLRRPCRNETRAHAWAIKCNSVQNTKQMYAIKQKSFPHYIWCAINKSKYVQIQNKHVQHTKQHMHTIHLCKIMIKYFVQYTTIFCATMCNTLPNKSSIKLCNTMCILCCMWTKNLCNTFSIACYPKFCAIFCEIECNINNVVNFYCTVLHKLLNDISEHYWKDLVCICWQSGSWLGFMSSSCHTGRDSLEHRDCWWRPTQAQAGKPGHRFSLSKSVAADDAAAAE